MSDLKVLFSLLTLTIILRRYLPSLKINVSTCSMQLGLLATTAQDMIDTILLNQVKFMKSLDTSRHTSHTSSTRKKALRGILSCPSICCYFNNVAGATSASLATEATRLRVTSRCVSPA